MRQYQRPSGWVRRAPMATPYSVSATSKRGARSPVSTAAPTPKLARSMPRVTSASR